MKYYIYHTNLAPNLRPLIALEIGNNAIATAHCPSRNSNFPRNVRNDFASQMLIDFNNVDWQMIGDFNFDSTNLDQQIPKGAEKVSQGLMTQTGGHILDYMIKNQNGSTFACQRADNPLWSDHYPVSYN